MTKKDKPIELRHENSAPKTSDLVNHAREVLEKVKAKKAKKKLVEYHLKLGETYTIVEVSPKMSYKHAQAILDETRKTIKNRW